MVKHARAAHRQRVESGGAEWDSPPPSSRPVVGFIVAVPGSTCTSCKRRLPAHPPSRWPLLRRRPIRPLERSARAICWRAGQPPRFFRQIKRTICQSAHFGGAVMNRARLVCPVSPLSAARARSVQCVSAPSKSSVFGAVSGGETAGLSRVGSSRYSDSRLDVTLAAAEVPRTLFLARRHVGGRPVTGWAARGTDPRR